MKRTFIQLTPKIMNIIKKSFSTFNFQLSIKLLLVSILVLCSCKQNKNQNKLVSANYEALVLNTIEVLTIDNSSLKIKDQKVFWGNDSINYTMLSEISANKLFFYFSEQTCTPCIEQTVELIAQHFPDYLKDNDEVVFISPDCIKRFRENCYGKKLLVFEDTVIDIPLEEENIPFIFTLSKDMRISNLHIVNKNDFKITADYLKKMSTSLR